MTRKTYNLTKQVLMVISAALSIALVVFLEVTA